MEIIWLVFILLFGACIGSFLNVVVYRLPLGKSLSFPPSHCPQCGRQIKWYDNIPIVSWILLRGRCRFCKTSISPRYPLVEAATALLLGGLYACYFILDIRDGAGKFEDNWPMFIAHATLVAGLLACALIDIEHWIVPLEVCWLVSLVGIICATACPPSQEFLPRVSGTMGAMSFAAGVGLLISLVLQKLGYLQPSFLDADGKSVTQDQPEEDSKKKGKKQQKITAVAFTKADGVNPRKEILREVLFLTPAIALAWLAWLGVTSIPVIRDFWAKLNNPAEGALAHHMIGLQAAVAGYMVGGLWIWGMRILGTLGFGKEAMGLGDVHILAAVGAVCGWIAPTLVFFVAPFFGLIWAVHLLISRKQRELPYGPWLAAATLVVIIFYDLFIDLLAPYFTRGA